MKLDKQDLRRLTNFTEQGIASEQYWGFLFFNLAMLIDIHKFLPISILAAKSRCFLESCLERGRARYRWLLEDFLVGLREGGFARVLVTRVCRFPPKPCRQNRLFFGLVCLLLFNFITEIVPFLCISWAVLTWDIRWTLLYSWHALARWCHVWPFVILPSVYFV